MIELKPPTDISDVSYNGPSVFLAGSIEQGKASNWQSKFVNAFKDVDYLTVLNPRREEWDASWVQSINNKQFREQVEWELYALDNATHKVFYFDPDTKSPITLFELGRYITDENVLVCCPNGYWRKGNVDIYCKKYNVPCYYTFEKLLEVFRTLI